MQDKKSLKDQIYTSLFQDIIGGVYKPGDILREKTLVEKYNVSKSPVREALIELCNEHVLRSIPRYGYEVVSLTDQDVRNILEFRQMLECACLDRYWGTFTPEQIKKLEVVAHSFPENCELSALLQWENNSAFHLALVSCCNNRYIYDMLKTAITTLTRAFAQFYWDRWRKTNFVLENTQHKMIVEYIKNGDKEKAIACLYNDMNEFGLK
ncbi:GntR family transcriptional regulator [Zongyangia hominis]|uniref:GntR family transcriptional regulator n=1 Tax=Zongyangia hominis TaxID=2763677 RepID=A0A926ECU2_9FIRM|nr:GntR family transcriptional regulator [Zongyangia hominis]MBC8570715.1 GntR family transcriptional regulator [Zongyangia hominis]